MATFYEWHAMVCYLGVRVPETSLSHDEKFVFFDFGVSGTRKNLKIFLGVPPKIFKKSGGLAWCSEEVLPPPRYGSGHANLLGGIGLE